MHLAVVALSADALRSYRVLCEISQQYLSTGKVVSLSNHCSNQHLYAYQFYLDSEDFRKQKAWLTPGSHIWTLQMFWEHPDVTERCSLWHLLCDQRDSFKQKVYQSLPQSLCSSQTRHSSALCQHLPSRFWNVLLVFRNHIILFRKKLFAFWLCFAARSKTRQRSQPWLPSDCSWNA